MRRVDVRAALREVHGHAEHEQRGHPADAAGLQDALSEFSPEEQQHDQVHNVEGAQRLKAGDEVCVASGPREEESDCERCHA